VIKKEEKVEALRNLHEIDVKVIVCETCEYVDERIGPMCRQLNHKILYDVCACI
jgi:hypothetical protein